MNIKILVKKINGEKQEPITVSEKQIDINYRAPLTPPLKKK